MDIIFNAIQIGLVVLVSSAGLLGLIAIISPRLFVSVSSYGNEVLNRNGAQCKERCFDIDHFVHIRLQPQMRDFIDKIRPFPRIEAIDSRYAQMAS